MFSGGIVSLSFPLTHHDQDIKTTRSIIANGRFYESTLIAEASIHHFAVRDSIFRDYLKSAALV
jgi:hypothetical protein